MYSEFLKTELNSEKPNNFIQDEIWLTVATSRTIHDLQFGILDFEAKKKKSVNYITAENLDELLVFNDEQDIREQFIQFGPSDDSYTVISKGLIEFTDLYPMDTTTFKVKSAKYDSTQALQNARLALISKGYLKEEVTDSAGITIALNLFQEHNGLKPDGVVGKYTSKALNESTAR